MNEQTIYTMDVIKRISLYQELKAEERIRWHVLFDCTCNVPACYYESPVEHSDTCPMHNPNNPNYDYL